jgi:hypothetical protein
VRVPGCAAAWGNCYYNFDGLRLDWRWRRGWGAMAFADAPPSEEIHFLIDY